MAAAPIFDICTPLRGGTIEPWRKATASGRPYRPPLRENEKRGVGAAFMAARAAPLRRTHHRRPHPVGARMARPYPAPATTRARGISNLVPGGYKIRPYNMDGEWCARRTAPDPGAGGPMWASAPTRRNHRTLAQSNGFRAAIQAAPTGKQKAWRRGGLHGRPCRTAASDAPPPTAPRRGRCPHRPARYRHQKHHRRPHPP